MKICSKCKELKSLSYFHKDNNKKDKHCSYCKDCNKKHAAAYQQKNPEKHNINSRKSYQKYKLEKNKYRIEYYNINKEKEKISCSIYRSNNIEMYNFYSSMYRASKLQASPKWLTSLQLDNIKLFYEAASQMTIEIGIPFEVDHIIPLQGKNVSGLHVPWNLQVLSLHDNRTKGNKV